MGAKKIEDEEKNTEGKWMEEVRGDVYKRRWGKKGRDEKKIGGEER